MAPCYFRIKAFTTVALLFFIYKTVDCTADAIDFVWGKKCILHEDSDSEDEGSLFEDLDTEEFPLPDKCPAPPPYEPPRPPNENN